MPRAKDEGDNREGRLRSRASAQPRWRRKAHERNIYARDVGDPSGAQKLNRLSDQTLNYTDMDAINLLKKGELITSQF